MSNRKALVSVITATYCKFDEIFDTIDSVIEQTYSEIEYIITDDGSIGFPEELIRKKLDDSGIRYQIIQHTTNMGTVKNLNYAYKKSNGKYIFNLSCGDIFFSNDTVQLLVDIFEKKKCKVLAASRLVYSDQNKPSCLLPHYVEREKIQKWNTPKKQYSALVTEMFYDMASGSAMYFDKDIFEEIGYYDEKYRLWEDGPFLSKYLQKYTIEFSYDIISIWYKTGGVSNSKDKNVSNIMKNDLRLYDNTDRVLNIEELDNKIKRRIKYRINKYSKNNLKKEKLFDVIHFSEFLCYEIYEINRKIAYILDKMIIKIKKIS